MNRKAPILAWAVAGALFTGALTGAAVAAAGNGIATPVRPFGPTSNRGEQPVQGTSEPHEGTGHDRGTGASGEGGQPGDDQSGGSTSGSTSGPDLESSGSGDSGESEEVSGNSGDDQDGDGGGSDD